MRISDWSSDVCSSDLHLKRAKFAAQRRHNLMTISVYSVEICHAPNLAVGCKVPVLAIATLRATRCPPLNLRMAMAPFQTHTAPMTERSARHRTTTASLHHGHLRNSKPHVVPRCALTE